MKRAICISIVLGSTAGVVLVEAADPDARLTIPLAIERLGSEAFADREEAAAFLWASGDEAMPSLEDAARSPELVVRRRASRLLERVRYGIFPTTPPEIAEHLHSYRMGDDQMRREAIGKLAALGAHESLMRLARVEEDGPLKAELAAQIGRVAKTTLPSLIIQGKFPEVEAYLELAAHRPEGIRLLAAYAAAREQLPGRIAGLRDAMQLNPQPIQDEQLVAFERAAGNLPAARLAAEKLGGKYRLLDIVIEQQDWATAAAVYRGMIPPEDQRNVVSWGRLAAYEKRAGADAGFRAAVERMKAFREPGDPRNHNPWFTAENLLVLEQVDDAIAILIDHQPVSALELLVRRGDYGRALAIAKCAEDTRFDEEWLDALPVGSTPADNMRRRQRHAIALALIPLLPQLGRREDAITILELLRSRLAPATSQESDGVRPGDLLKAAMRAGLTTQARELAGQMADAGANPALWSTLFGSRAGLAAHLYELLRRRKPPMEASKALAVVGSLVTPDPTREPPIGELDDLAAEASASAAAVADTYLLLGRRDLARKSLERRADSQDVPAAIRLGDLAREDGDMAAARAWYAKAWTFAARPEIDGKKPSRPSPQQIQSGAVPDSHGIAALYLLGRATGGDEGIRHQQTAILLSLETEKMQALARALAERGLKDDAKKLWELILRTTSHSDWHFGETAKQLGNALSRTDPIRAANLWEPLLLGTLDTSSAFMEIEGYLEIAFMIHKVRGHGLLEAGRVDEAWREFEACQKILPGDIVLTETIVPLLDEAGEHQKADEVFRLGYERARAHSAAWPAAAGFHNNLAWIAARCHRELDDALEHARQAVALEPTSAAYVDTLAEVYFHRGDRAAAVEHARRATALAPEDKHLASRLTGFEKDPLPGRGKKSE